jgi:hypothetical protein
MDSMSSRFLQWTQQVSENGSVRSRFLQMDSAGFCKWTLCAQVSANGHCEQQVSANLLCEQQVSEMDSVSSRFLQMDSVSRRFLQIDSAGFCKWTL